MDGHIKEQFEDLKEAYDYLMFGYDDYVWECHGENKFGDPTSYILARHEDYWHEEYDQKEKQFFHTLTHDKLYKKTDAIIDMYENIEHSPRMIYLIADHENLLHGVINRCNDTKKNGCYWILKAEKYWNALYKATCVIPEITHIKRLPRAINSLTPEYASTIKNEIARFLTYLFLMSRSNHPEQEFNLAMQAFYAQYKIDNNNIEELEGRLCEWGRILPCCNYNEDSRYCEAKILPSKENEWLKYCPRTKKWLSDIKNEKTHPGSYHPKNCSSEGMLGAFLKKQHIILTDEMLKKKKPFDSRHRNYYARRYFIGKLSGMMNRLAELQSRLKCKVCGQYMHFNPIYSKADQAAYMVTTAHCENKDCSEYKEYIEHHKEIYFNHCYRCESIVDSRDCELDEDAPFPFYKCEHCGAGYKEYVAVKNRHIVE